MSTVRIAGRPRRWPFVLVGVLVALFVILSALAGFVIDVLWYGEIDQSEVFWTTLWTKVLLGLVFGLVFFGLLFANLLIAKRLRPTTRVLTPDQEVLDRIRDLSDPFLRWLIPAGAAVLGLFVAIGVSREWQTFLLWRNSNGVTFGSAEPQFDRDPAFYVFTLPWLEFLQGWLFSALVGVTILTAIAHVLWGGIRPQAPAFADKVTPAARAHLSVLLGLIMLVKAWGYWLGRFDLLTSRRGVVEGASYTDVNAQLPALNLLVIVAVICAVLFFLNIRLRQWALPLIAVGLLVLASVLLGTAYPAFIQRFRVEPNEQQLESIYIDYNIDATREAFGLDAFVPQERDVGGPLTASQLELNAPTVSNIRLWRGLPVMLENFQSLERFRQYYDFSDVDVDRYVIEGERRVLQVSAREIAQSGLDPSAQTWQNVHLAYTHGYGAVAAPVNTATVEGQPAFTLENLPPEGDPVLEEPRIYYGESDDVRFVVVGTTTNELDFSGAPESAPYAGEGGIPLSNILTRVLFAWQFRDYNLLVSNSITSESKIMIYRDIATRVQKAVPFLAFDSDPYFAVVEGQPVWIWDAYTFTEQYPYSQAVDASTATGGLLEGEANYLRNPVKAVVNAYEGTITYYADLEEPILQVWDRAFPTLFTPKAEAPELLQDHFRYPENLFQVQAFQYANYHVTDPTAFYQKRDFWQLPADPTIPATAEGGQPTMSPYYQLTRLPGQVDERFNLVVPFTPAGRLNMVALMGASSDPETYGEVSVFEFPEGRNIEGPSQVFARINQDPEFSGRRTLLSQAGSDVLFGDFLTIPIEESFLYVQPVYVRADQENAIPQLTFVVVVNGSDGDVFLGDSLGDAIALAVEGGDGIEPPPPDGGGTVEEQIQQLLDDAAAYFEAAQVALDAGDLGTYQEQVELAQQAVEDAAALAAGGEGEPGASPTPSASATPTP